MICENGTIVFFSLIILVWRLPRNTMLCLFGHPLWLEFPYGVLAYALHYGTLSGMMAAATACILASAYVRIGKRMFGYINSGVYHPVLVTMTGVTK